MAKTLEEVHQDVLTVGKKLQDLGPEIDKKIDLINDQIQKAGTEWKKEVKGDLKEALDLYSKLSGDKEKGEKAWHELATDQLAELEKSIQQIQEWKPNNPAPETNKFHQKFMEVTENGERLKKMKGEDGNRGQKDEVVMEIERKAVVTEAGALTGDVIVHGRAPGFKVKPEEANHIRQIMRTGFTASNRWWHVAETGYTNNTAAIAEGAAFPQNDFDLTQVETVNKKLAAHKKLSNEILQDLPGVMTYAQGRLMTKMFLLEDNEVLLADGTGQHVDSINNQATAYGPGALFQNLYGTGATRIDVLGTAINQARVTTSEGLYNPNVIIVHPSDVTVAQSIKLTDDDYLLRAALLTDAPLRVKGVGTFETTVQTAGTYTVGDFNQGAELIDSETMTIEISNSDQDDFIKDLVTIRIKERIILPVYFTGAFISGTFAAGITYLNA